MKKLFLTVFAFSTFICGKAETITLEIPDETSFGDWTVLDANNDGTVWEYSNSNSYNTAMYHAGNAANDWIVSPAVNLKGGVTYNVSAILRVETSTPRFSSHNFTVYAGSQPTVDALTSKIVEKAGAEYSLDPKSYSGTFTPEADGNYYFSVHCTSGGWNDDLHFFRFEIEGTESGGDTEVQTTPLPYSEDFSTSDHGYTFYHQNSESRDWDISSQRLRYYGRNYYTSDAYAISPAFGFEAGKTYELTFTTWISSSSSSNYKPLNVKLGKGKDANSLTTDIFSETIQTSSQTKKTVKFNVDDDGVYYLAFYCGGDVNLNDIYVDDVTLKEIITAPLAVTGLTASAAEKGALQAIISWTNPSLTNTGEALQSISKAVISRGGEEIYTLTENLVVGEKSSYTDVSVPNPGKYEYSVVVYQGDGASEPAKTTSGWIGKDTSVGNVSNVVAEVIDDHTASVNFDAVTVGSNGGYVDPADVAYRIDRKAGSKTAETIAQSYTGELPYVDSNVNGLNSYTYSVYTIYQGQNVTSTFAPPTSNAIVLGGGVDLPYSQDFTDTSNHFFTFFHGAGSTRDWIVSSSKYLDYWGNPADAYAVTPGLNLEAGKAYELTFSTWRTGTEKPLYVRTGKSATIEGLDTELFFEKINSGITAQKSIKFSVQENGVYYLAFHCKGEVDSYNDLYVDNIKVEEIALAPLAPTDFSVTAGEKGSLKAILTWTNPSLNNAGSALTEIDKIVVKRGNEAIATIEKDLTPGEVASYADETVGQAGPYTYSITAYLGENASDAVSAGVDWVGPDTPKPVESAAATLNDDHTEMEISWEAVGAEGVHGGYVDVASIKYKVVRMPGNYVVAEETSQTSVTDNVTELGLGNYYYEISLVGYPDVEAFATEKQMLGDAIELPYKPDFSDSSEFEIWTFDPKEWAVTNNLLPCLQPSGYSETWAITPPFKAVKGRFELDYSGSCRSSLSAETVEVYLIPDGVDFKSAELTPVQTDVFESTFADKKTVEFETPAKGVYRIGFKLTPKWTFSLYSSDIELIEEYITYPPVAATDFKAEAAAEGRLEVNLSWTNPSTDTNDGDLQEITNVTISRDGEVIAQLAENIVPGEKSTFKDDKITEAGKYAYSITFNVEDVESEATTAQTGWVGPDTPKPVENASVTLSDDGSTATISWDAVSDAGVNGGYVNASAITYKVVRMPGEVVVVESTSATSANETVASLVLGEYSYEISLNEYPDVEATSTEPISFGTAITPAAAEDFEAVEGEKGAMKVTLTWTNPTKDTVGRDLQTLTKALILRGETTVATISEGLTPGDKYTYVDESVPAAGEHTYSVKLYADDNESEPVNATTGWVGADTPAPVENATATLDSDNNTVTVTWDAVDETGVNGGYVDADNVTYTVVRMPGEVVIGENISETTITDNISELENGTYWYEVSVDGTDDSAVRTNEITIEKSGIVSAAVDGCYVAYNRADGIVRFAGSDLHVFTAGGAKVGKSDSTAGTFDMSKFNAGVYIARCGQSIIKFVK